MREFLTEAEIDRLPRIRELRRGKEPVPRCVLHVAKRVEPTPEDIEWAKQVVKGGRGCESG